MREIHNSTTTRVVRVASRKNNRYLLYFYKDISLGAVHLKYITVYLLIKVSNLKIENLR